MVFENQLLVLNSFLPMDGLSELEVKLTYTDGTKRKGLGGAGSSGGSSSSSDIQFYFEDVGPMDEED